MEFKWMMICFAVIAAGGSVAAAVSSFSENSRNTQIGVACVQAGKEWVNDDCRSPLSDLAVELMESKPN